MTEIKKETKDLFILFNNRENKFADCDGHYYLTYIMDDIDLDYCYDSKQDAKTALTRAIKEVNKAITYNEQCICSIKKSNYSEDSVQKEHVQTFEEIVNRYKKTLTFLADCEIKKITVLVKYELEDVAGNDI